MTSGMVYCRGCGKEIHGTAPTCPMCGAPQGMPPGTSGAAMAGSATEVPAGVAGWSWGAFLLSGIWAIGNRTWIGLLAFVPYIGLVMVIILGIKGREWAWKKGGWRDVAHFNAVQRKWSIAGWVVTAILAAVMVAVMASDG